mmetsp:Transcript_98583/g.307054  ORF Transcript_98583/g.307054 Transcript_98583/m.307054 type:complete len:227 (-) Transcript_98583:1104-1784(-)
MQDDMDGHPQMVYLGSFIALLPHGPPAAHPVLSIFTSAQTREPTATRTAPLRAAARTTEARSAATVALRTASWACASRSSSSMVHIGEHRPSSAPCGCGGCCPRAAPMCCAISSSEAVEPWPTASSHSSGRCSAVVPETCGYGHSRGKAWCNHCARSRPCSGTCPPWCSATSLRRCTSPADSVPLVEVEGKALTSSTISSDVAVGRPRLLSRWLTSSSHSSMQQTA